MGEFRILGKCHYCSGMTSVCDGTVGHEYELSCRSAGLFCIGVDQKDTLHPVTETAAGAVYSDACLAMTR